MASDGSVAPKERVNIVYTSDTGGAQEQVELPLKQLVLGDFTLREDDTPLENIKPIRVDKDNFSDVLKGQNLSLQLNVANQPDRHGEVHQFLRHRQEPAGEKGDSLHQRKSPGRGAGAGAHW